MTSARPPLREAGSGHAEALLGSTIAADGCTGVVPYLTPAGLGVFRHGPVPARLAGMSIEDDLHQTAVAAVERAIQIPLWDVSPSRRQQVAEAAVRAAAPYLDGTERARVLTSEASGTVTP